MKRYPGRDVPTGQAGAGLVTEALTEEEIKANVPINVDVIGIGASVYDILSETLNAIPVNFAEGSTGVDKTGKYKFRNVRAEAYWRLREALDPEKGAGIALPPDNELLGDLVAQRWKLTLGGILLEEKEDVRERLGRSPDSSDSVALANLIYEVMLGFA